jgi:histidinol-phosphate aminotransferase
MSSHIPVRSEIEKLNVYAPGKPIEEVKREFGLERIIKLASNENPMGYSPLAKEAMIRELQRVTLYPEATSPVLVSRLAERLGVHTSEVLVGNGSDELIRLVTRSYIQSGDEAIMADVTFPRYETNVVIDGGNVVKVPLVKGVHDLDAMLEAVTSKTRMIFVCNPNNPTGAILTTEEMNAIVRIAARNGSWILADEIYQGSERDGKTTQTFWGRYDRVIITNGLSKAYGLPGLRIGWIVAPQDLIAKMWSYHDYITIAPGTLSDTLARVALSASGRTRCLERTRTICRHNFPLLREWMDSHGSMFRMVEPRAGAIVYVHYDLAVNSTELVMRLLKEKSVLIVPGDHFGIDGYLRIGYGPQPDYLRQGLEHMNDLLGQISGNTQASESRG